LTKAPYEDLLYSDRNAYTFYFQGHIENVKVLLANKAKVNAANCVGDTALHVAAAHGFVDIVTILLRRHADVRIKNALWKTPLFHACQNNTTAILELLLSQQKPASIMPFLWSKSNLIVDTDNMGNTLLHTACHYGQKEIIAFLLEKKLSICLRNKNEMNPFDIVCAHGYHYLVETLLKKGNKSFALLCHA
jgi:ankyrin repeat protein